MGRRASRAACQRGALARSVSVTPRSFPRAHRYTQVLLEEYDDDRSYASRGNASQDAPRPLSNVAQMCAQAPALSTSCARHRLSPQSVPFVTRSVTGGMPTRSDGHDQFQSRLSGRSASRFRAQLPERPKPRQKKSRVNLLSRVRESEPAREIMGATYRDVRPTNRP